ncbi:MAG: hypothetical protein KatS3mg061_2247 [Dehalococcoidia bacterium]|nr:MAG: hypothetical protein KatS3mg061_2247 [Dehalococcoidia bacterium]
MKRHLRLGVLAAIAVTLGWGIGRGQAAEVVRLVALPAIAQTTTVSIEMGDYYFKPGQPHPGGWELYHRSGQRGRKAP